MAESVNGSAEVVLVEVQRQRTRVHAEGWERFVAPNREKETGRKVAHHT